MLFPALAKLLWGLDDPSGAYRFAQGYGAALMLGWTVLLVWAYQRPLERRGVAALTLVVIAGFVLTELVSAASGWVAVARLLPTWGLQALLSVLFGWAYAASRPTPRGEGAGVRSVS
jgi:hypothetical protein